MPKKSDVKSVANSLPSGDVKWPTMEPLLSAEDLTITTLLTGQIVTISELWTPTLCKKFVTHLNTLPLVTTPKLPKKGDAVRVNDRLQLHDPSFAEMLWNQTALRQLICAESQAENQEQQNIWGGQVVGLNPNIRIYRYSEGGQHFAQHYDESNTVQLTDPPRRARTTWTLLLYLTSCEGGETVFYPEAEGPKKKRAPQPDPISISPEPGLALLHKHGSDCLLHEALEVKSGMKWVIRSDLVVI